MSGTPGWLRPAEGQDGESGVALGGDWSVSQASVLEAAVRAEEAKGAGAAAASPLAMIDLSAVENLDTAGAWLILRLQSAAQARGGAGEIAHASADHALLLETVGRYAEDTRNERAVRVQRWRIIEHVGAAAIALARQARAFVGFLGLFVITMGRLAGSPGRVRLTSLVHHMEQVGLNAVPIVSLISFLIGVVLAYQGASQLQQFGAEIFVVNLIGISILREIGILLAAIVIAGRSGSAFTAQIGSMMLREEVDAMRAMGLDPIELLVAPRVLALVLTMPMLAFIADLMGLLGGGLMSWIVLDVSPQIFVTRLNDSVGMWTFWVGIIKAPVFALLIGLVGCYEGFQVRASAESVGRMTTRSVVEAIFLVIVADALFSIFFQLVGV